MRRFARPVTLLLALVFAQFAMAQTRTFVAYVGSYSSVTTYNLNDMVSSGSEFYISLVANNLNNPPPSSPAQWALISTGTGAAGPTGATGPAGLTGATGATAATGPAGPPGTQGTAGATGPPGLTWLGAWSSSTAYVVTDAVSYGGSSYMATQSSTNQNPATASLYWSLIVQAGAIGSVGATGMQGIPGPTGTTGPAGATGPPGSMGPAGAAGLSATAVAGEATALLLSQQPTVVNLFDKNRIADGNAILQGTGGLAGESGIFATDYMLVAGASQVTVSTSPFQGNSLFGYAFYDVSQTYLSGGQTGGGGYSGSPQTIAVPSSAVYFRTSANDDAFYTFMTVRGAPLPSTYVPFAQPPFVLTSTGVQAVLTPSMVSPLNGATIGVWGDSISALFGNAWQNVVTARTGATLGFEDARPGRGMANWFECYANGLTPGSTLGTYNTSDSAGNCGVYADTGAVNGNTLAQNLASVQMLIIQDGTNDQGWCETDCGNIGDATNSGSLYGYMRWVLENLIAANHTMHIVWVGPQDNGEGTHAQTQAVIAAEQAECALYGIPYLNLSAVGGGSAFNGPWYTNGDLTHPSNYTFAHFYGPIVAQFIQQYF